ncbi:LytTR family transcriptional regulator DNA-binding domain-containing protein [Staphylococcus epidermidis]|uniref:LytTR family transcriptional regulator DNA-binding domain-containing protein n=1 Tax=Staphylococcus epidermidis TaxID=1282 RepID=UPI0021B298F5|nr:LytTR family transcriptional regulator DNA-binding domain-containing protein [Staphylococcus epidermidis]
MDRGTIVNKEDMERIEDWFNYRYEVRLTDEFKYEVSGCYMKSFKEEVGVE